MVSGSSPVVDVMDGSLLHLGNKRGMVRNAVKINAV